MESLRTFIYTDPVLSDILTEVESQMGKKDPSHDTQHLLRVAMWTARLNPDGKFHNSVTAALMHDIFNVRKDDPRNATASIVSASWARNLLSYYPQQYSPTDIEDICQAIADHSFSKGATPSSALGKALQDADRLDALGVVGVYRLAACGIQLGGTLYHPSDPWGLNRKLDDKTYSLDHFQTKLFRIASMMNTEKGKQEAYIRTARMTRMLITLGEEIGYPYPPE